MNQEIHPNITRGAKRIVILGAGYGGLRAAMRLASLRRSGLAFEVFLVDQNDCHHLMTELHEVAAATIPPDAAVIPLSRLLAGTDVTFLQTRVTGFDFDGQRVLTQSGELTYDTLVVALGSETDFFGIEGLEDHGLTLKSTQDALRIKERVDKMFALARTEPDLEERKSLLTVVVGGGGFTGTELAGELSDRVLDLIREYDFPPGEARVVVVEAANTLLSGFDPALVQTAKKILESKGVELFLGAPAVNVKADVVELKDGRKIRNHTLIWTGGVKANELIAHSGLQTGVRGRVIVNPFLESVDYLNVFVVGDAALTMNHETGRPLAPSAQLALQEADAAAASVQAQLRGLPLVAFQPNVTSEVVSIGRHDGLAKIGPLALNGRAAHMLKRVVLLRYLHMLGGFPPVKDRLGLMVASARKAGAMPQ